MKDTKIGDHTLAATNLESCVIWLELIHTVITYFYFPRFQDVLVAQNRKNRN